MPEQDDRTRALRAVSMRLAEIAAIAGDVGRLLTDEIERVDGELAEVRDGLLALSNRISATDRVLASRTEHLA